MVRHVSLALALVLLVVASVPASAGMVTVGAVSASQYHYPYFGAVVYATGTTMLGDLHFTVTRPDGTFSVVQPERITRTDLDATGTYVIYQATILALDVVRPGDVLTAIVRDHDAEDGSKGVLCVGPSKKKSAQTATCK